MKSFLSLFACLMLIRIVSGQPGAENIFIEKSIPLSTGVKLNYVEKGNSSGTPIIFLHGYTDSWHSFEEVMKYLPASVHAFAITQRGHGNSDKPENKYSVRVFAEDVAAFMKQLGIESAVIVGHSMGATITQRFVLDYPALTKGFVLAGGIATFQDKALLEFNALIQSLPDPVPYNFAEEFQKSTLVKPIDAAILNLFISESLKVPANVWKSIMLNLVQADYTKELTKINKPALVLWGDRDEIGQRADQDIFLKSIKRSKLIVYKDHGHALHWEDPKRFANDIERFVENIKKPK